MKNSLVLVFGLLSIGSAPAAEITWETVDGVDQFRFDTELLSGAFVARDSRDLGKGYARHGLRGLTFKPTGKDVHAPDDAVGGRRRHQGHFNLYRVYAGSETFGSLRDDVAQFDTLKDGARLTWPASESRPVTVTASWRMTGPAQFDLELIAVPERDLENFEILPASYCPVEMVKSVYLEREGAPTPVTVKTPTDSEAAELYPFFPLTDEDRAPQEASGRIQSEWKWRTSVEDENAALPIVLADDGMTEILLLGDPSSTSAVCATPRPDTGAPEDWNSVGKHSALYLSFFCRDVKAGEKQTARARLIFREKTDDSTEQHRQLYRGFIAKKSSAARLWPKHIIQPASETRGMINTAVADDWNRDGHTDVIASFNGTVTLVLGPDWKKRVLLHRLPARGKNRAALGSGGCIHSCTLDVDGDGDLDFVGSNNTVFWLECPDRPLREPWIYRTVDDEIKGTHCLITGDVDGDGVLDLIANSGRDAQATAVPLSITWQKIPADWENAPHWERNVFAEGDAPGGSHYMGFGDVNGDGRPDISCAAKGGEKFPGGEWFAWWEQPEDPTGVWEKHLLAESEIGATNIIPVDLNGDGHMDFAATRGHGAGALWFRGPDFEKIEIDPNIAAPHSLALGDIDGDGTVDIATCGKEADGEAAFYRNDGAGGFTRHTVARDQGSYDLRLVDMDRDGDLDFLIAGHASDNVVWLENPK